MAFNPLDYPICLTQPKRVLASTWLSHVPFAMFLIDALRPRVVVELGAYSGVSYCAFCQAVKKLGIGTQCYAIDLWEGDNHGGFYSTAVLDDLRKYHDPLYGDFSVLVQSSFDAAVNQFAEGTIDLLHIDGLHTYEAVKKDFESWLPRMSDKGIMLFHDTQVKASDFGVWRFWEEISSKYPHFEMAHGYGLGILAVGNQCPVPLRSIIESSADDFDRIKDFFCELGSNVERLYQSAQLVSEQERKVNDLERTVVQFTSHPVFKLYHWIKYIGRE